jgi:hypothetical protein
VNRKQGDKMKMKKSVVLSVAVMLPSLAVAGLWFQQALARGLNDSGCNFTAESSSSSLGTAGGSFQVQIRDSSTGTGCGEVVVDLLVEHSGEGRLWQGQQSITVGSKGSTLFRVPLSKTYDRLSATYTLKDSAGYIFQDREAICDYRDGPGGGKSGSCRWRN